MSHNCIDKKLVSFLEEAQAADDNSQESSEPEYDPRGPPGTKLTKKDIIKLKWENYWRSFTTVINAKVFRIWGILEQALIAYNRLLKERCVLMLRIPWSLVISAFMFNEAFEGKEQKLTEASMGVGGGTYGIQQVDHIRGNFLKGAKCIPTPGIAPMFEQGLVRHTFLCQRLSSIVCFS